MTQAVIEFYRENDGAFAIGNALKNPALVSSGTVATVTNTRTSGGSMFSVSWTNGGGTRPICAIGASASLAFRESVQRTGNAWTWYFVTTAAVGTSFSYYIFDIRTPSKPAVGFVLYADAPGEPMTFSTHPDHKPVVSMDVVSTSSNSTISFASGRSYAWSQGRYAGQLQFQNGARAPNNLPSPEYWALIGSAIGQRFSGTDLVFGTIRLDPPTSQFSGTDSPNYSSERTWFEKQIMVLDVTGY